MDKIHSHRKKKRVTTEKKKNPIHQNVSTTRHFTIKERINDSEGGRNGFGGGSRRGDRVEVEEKGGKGGQS